MATVDTDLQNDQSRSIKAEWLQRLAELIERVEKWAVECDWSTRRIEKTMHDSQIGDYVAPALLLQKEVVRGLLEPIARTSIGSEGVVDLYLMPAYDDIATLFSRDGIWHVHHATTETSAADLPNDNTGLALSRDVLVRVLEEMVKNADRRLR